MRNTNLRQVDYFSALFDSLDMLDVRLMAYKSQARTYLLSNADDIISKYAKLIYQELCIQNTEVQNHYYGELKTGAMGRSVAYEIISAYTTICEDVLILFNPLDKEPAVVEDAYIFSDYDIGAFEEKILSEYIERKKENEDNFEDLCAVGKFVAGKAVSGTVGSGVAKLGNLALLRANRLSTLAKHYDGAHQSRMRVQRSFRGKTAQRNMMKQISLKGKNLSKMANIYKQGGSFAKGRGVSSAKGALKPITMFDALKTLNAEARDCTTSERVRMERLIPEELTKYCEKNNNYRCLPKYFFE